MPSRAVTARYRPPNITNRRMVHSLRRNVLSACYYASQGTRPSWIVIDVGVRRDSAGRDYDTLPMIGIFLPVPRTIGSSSRLRDSADSSPDFHSSAPGGFHSWVGGAATPVWIWPATSNGSFGCKVRGDRAEQIHHRVGFRQQRGRPRRRRGRLGPRGNFPPGPARSAGPA